MGENEDECNFGYIQFNVPSGRPQRDAKQVVESRCVVPEKDTDWS